LSGWKDELFHPDSHPFWFLMAVLLWVLAFLILWGVVAGASQLVTTNEVRTIDFTGEHMPSDAVARAPNNNLLHGYVTTDYRLNVSRSSNNGSSWSEEEVISTSWESHLTLTWGGIHTLSNNTTVVFFGATFASSYSGLYLAFRWQDVGSWEVVQVYKTTSYFAWIDAAVNDTDRVAIAGNYGSGSSVRTAIYNPSARSWVTSWLAWDTYNSAICHNVVANATGTFWLSWAYWDGSNNRICWRDVAKTQTLKYSAWTGSTITPWYNSAVCPNGWYVASCNWYYSGGGTYGWRVWRMNPVTFTISYQLIQSPAATPGWVVGSAISVDANNYVTIIGYDITNDNIYRWRASYDADDTTWQGSKVMIYSSPDTNDLVGMRAGTVSLWPQVSDTPVNMPLTGYACGWVWQDELGATDDFLVQVCINATYPWIDYAPVEIGNTDTSGSTFYAGNFIYWDFQVTGGNSPYSWSLVDLSGYTASLYVNLTSGEIYGDTPAAAGVYYVVVRVVDFYGNTDQENVSVEVSAAGAIGPGPGPEPEENAQPLLLPTSFMGMLWYVLMALALVAGVVQTIRRHMDNAGARMDKTLWEKLR